VKKVSKESFAQLFTPRNQKSSYSPLNKERLKNLIAKKKVIKPVLVTLPELPEGAFVIPPDILKALKADKLVWKNFQSFPERYKRIRIGFINGSRSRPDAFKQRLAYFTKMTAQNKRYGTMK
jgi:hypothetical protein